MNRVGTPQLYSESPGPAGEAAVLFSAGFAQAAAALLEAQIGREEQITPRPVWLMLHELYHLAGRRADFHALCERFCRRFGGRSGPPWGFPSAIQAPGTYALRGVVTSSSEDLSRILTHGTMPKTLAIDMGEVERIDFGSISAFSALLRNFKVAGKRVILVNTSELNAVLLEVVGADHCAVTMRRRVALEPEEGEPSTHPLGVHSSLVLAAA